MRAREWLGRAGPFLGLVLVSGIFGALVGSRFFSAGNLELISRQTSIVCVAGLGMTMIIVSGGIDLSVGSTIALGTVTIAMMLRAGASPALAASAGVALGAAHDAAGN